MRRRSRESGLQELIWIDLSSQVDCQLLEKVVVDHLHACAMLSGNTWSKQKQRQNLDAFTCVCSRSESSAEAQRLAHDPLRVAWMTFDRQPLVNCHALDSLAASTDPQQVPGSNRMTSVYQTTAPDTALLTGTP